ncbi:MAG: ABC transporter substrate-binding protein [Ruminococcaceae bacterium]|nr:ABC transporter substrate-binding protein [Oscillospiraceae bacterium]
MREKIYTIPLSEAYETPSECPFCLLEERLEKEAVEYALGASMMEPDSRIISNEKGYCRRHFKMMLSGQEALSLALVLDTHLGESVKKIKDALGNQKRGKMLKKGKEDELLSVVSSINNSCVICEKITGTLDKFSEVFWFLYKTESDFREKVLKSQGFCLQHFYQVMSKIGSEFSGKAKEKARTEICELEIANLERINEEVNWFTKKFDYRFTNEPWKNSKDSPQRAILKLSKF